jgi:hypothetical protein
MKQNKRRSEGSFPYYKLATFDAISFCFRDGKVAYATEAEAKAAAKKPGSYRVSVVHENGRSDMHAFDVGNLASARP